ncbi:VanZ family protein [Cellulosimicrobium cellulans]|uniref:VanZ family protein n=1 Tax=Cellulosimicrobium cellulans TaxID=1710 RepID=UPI00382B04E5
MISTLLVAHPWLSPLALLVLAVAGPLVGAWLAGRRPLAWVLFGVSLLPVLLLTLVPVERELFAVCTVSWSLPTPGRVELLANVVLFVPPVLLAAVALGRPLIALLGGVAASALIEVVQALAPALGRSCDTNDWLSNSIGALLGAGLAVVALRLATRRDRVANPGSVPTARRS